MEVHGGPSRVDDAIYSPSSKEEINLVHSAADDPPVR